MRRSFEEVRQIAHTLPENERILLANSLWESVVSAEPEADGAEVAAAWDDEVKRRVEEIDSGVVKLLPEDEVRAEIVARLSLRARARLRA
jgi:putative addiction module component (TIGR02574 family)